MLNRKQFLSGLSALGAAVPLAPRTAVAQPAASGVTAEIAGFVAGAKWETLSPSLVELSKKHILDCMGLMLAGERAETGPLVRTYLQGLGVTTGAGTASIIGTNLRAAPRFAAFANALAIHADDYDDTQLAVAKTRVYGLLTHPSATALPPALALAEAGARTGRDFLLAYHMGVEVETKLAEASNPRAYEDGFHSTGLFGIFGATISAAKMRGLDAKTTRNALGIAGAQASGLRENFGTMSKPFQAGHAAESGVLSADLAALKYSGAENIFEAKRGFFNAAAGGFDVQAIAGKLGKPWSFQMPGVSIKPYPCGSLAHPAMDEMRRLVRANAIKPDDVVSIRVGGNKGMLNALIHPRPTNGLEAKFSMPYMMAVLVVDGKAGLMQFQDAAVNRPVVQALLRRVEFYNNPVSDSLGTAKMHSIIDIKLKNGRTISGAADYARGSPQFPMSFEDVKEKFRDCAAYARFPTATAEQIIAQVQAIDRLDDIRKLTRLLSRA